MKCHLTMSHNNLCCGTLTLLTYEVGCLLAPIGRRVEDGSASPSPLSGQPSTKAGTTLKAYCLEALLALVKALLTFVVVLLAS